MGWSRVVSYHNRVRSQVRAAFSENHPPHQIAASFSVGLFTTALPTLGTGVIALAALGYRCEWANRLALFAAVAVLNPLAKSAVYVSSFALGTALLGPVSGVTHREIDISLSAGADVLARLLLGNAIIAVGFAIVGYVGALYGVSALRQYRS